MEVSESSGAAGATASTGISGGAGANRENTRIQVTVQNDEERKTNPVNGGDVPSLEEQRLVDEHIERLTGAINHMLSGF